MKILHYSHDSLGLGHIRRTLAIVRRLAHDLPDTGQLVLTGSMQFGAYEWPPHVDCVKLPTLRKKTTGEYHSPHLHGSLEAVSALRESLILSTINHFNPDLVLVDKAPAGLNGEMMRALQCLKQERPQTLLVLGMRDIEDDSQTTRRDWASGNIYPLLENIYDAILLYGVREIFDPVTEYHLSPTIARKMYPCGYIFGADERVVPAERLRGTLHIQTETERLVLVTAGGGSDGFQLIKTYLEMLASRPTPAPFHTLIVAGPQLEAVDYQVLELYIAAMVTSRVTLKRFIPHLSSYLRFADLVVTMGGYNTVMEILGYGRRSIIVPRVSPRREQLIRAERLAARNLVRMIHPDELTPARLLAEMDAALEQGDVVAPAEMGLSMDGAEQASLILAELLNTRAHTMKATSLACAEETGSNKNPSAVPAWERRKNRNRRRGDRAGEETSTVGETSIVGEISTVEETSNE